MGFYKVRAPNLPITRQTYDPQQQEQLSNALRLYFNRLDSTFAELADPLGGAGLNRPCALYYSTTDQSAGNTDEAYPVEFENTYFENGMTISGNTDSEITVDRSGIYNFQFSGQLFSSSSNAKTAQIWIRRNDIDIGYSAHAYTDDMNNGYLEVNWNFNIDLQAGDYIEIMWATDDTDLSFESVAPSAPYPGISSTVMAVNFISNLEGFSIATAP